MSFKLGLLVGTGAFALAVAPAFADPAGGEVDGSASSVREIVVTAQRLNNARSTIEASLGATTYTLTNQAIESLPGGDNAGLNQVVLQTPGVTQDSFGQLHVRGDHANIQYRINNVILPEGLAVFGQTLSPRLADSVELITGALPAQYGLRTAGIVNIKTKSGFGDESRASLYGGSNGTIQPSLEISGSKDANSWFLSGSYLQSDVGIESPDGSARPVYDQTRQYQAFGYFDHIIDPQSRAELIFGASDQRFQIPQRSGLHANTDGFTDLAGDPLTVNGTADFLSQDIKSTQHETTDFGIASYTRATENASMQLSAFARYSSLDYQPDVLGELLFNGIAQQARKADTAFGLQAEGVYHLNDRHTVRGGVIVQFDRSTSDTTSEVLAVDGAGHAANTPSVIIDNGARNAQSYSAYVQDEWKPIEALTINYGLRFDLVDALRNENQLSPRLNFVWTPTESTTLHGGYSRYFTPPSFELVTSQTLTKFVGTTAAPISLTNTTPFAERADYFDLGVQQKLLPGLTLGVDAYYRKSRNLLDEGQFGAPIILTPFNYRDGRVQGIDFSSTYARGAFSAYANFAISKAEGRDIVSSQFNFDPGDLAYMAGHYIFVDHDQRYTASAGASYHWGPTRLSADLLYGSGLRADDPVTGIPNGGKVPAYTQVNTSLSHKLELPGAGALDVRFDIVNLFDEKYLIRDGTGVGVGQPQWGPRRGFFVGLSKTF
ncbi:MAG: TonB-dependent receptor [Proteobacteria bacterium]|nr:TonB-dependent receptor [Pseudomonadota bacterium]